MNSADIERVVKAAEALGDYPRAVTMMFEAGITGYTTDVRAHSLVYRSVDASWVETGPPPGEAEEPEREFSLDAVKGAIRAYGRGEFDYTGFLGKLWLSGISTYEVDLAVRTVSYLGRNGEAHVVHVPQG